MPFEVMAECGNERHYYLDQYEMIEQLTKIQKMEMSLCGGSIKTRSTLLVDSQYCWLPKRI